MHLARCFGCRQRPQSKFTSVYAAWFDEPGDRRAVKLRLCDACLQEHVQPFSLELDPEEPLSCPSCHINTDDEYAAIYAKVFMPGCEPFDVEIPFCGSCQMIWREWATTHGVSLENRRRADIGPSIPSSGIDILRAMGITPRAR